MAPRLTFVAIVLVCLLCACGTGPGSSSPVAGSPSPSQSNTYIFVRNDQGGPILHVLKLGSDGTLQEVSGSPFSITSSSLSIAGNYLIAGSSSGPASYKVDPASGSLSQSSSAVAAGNVASDAAHVYVGTSTGLNGYSIQNGSLTPLPGSPFFPTTPDPCGCATPDYTSLSIDSEYLLMAISADHAGSGASFAKIGSDGSLGAETSFFNGGTSPSTGIRLAPNGRFVYAVSDGGPTQVYTFDASAGTMSSGASALPNDAGDALDGVFDPSTTFYLSYQQPYDPNNYFTDSTITLSRVDPSTGAISPVISHQDFNHSHPMAFDPSGRYMLSIDQPTESTFAVTSYAFDSTTGNLTKVATVPIGKFASDYFPGGLVVGKF